MASVILRRLSLTALLCCAALAGCSGSEPAVRNLLLVTIDTTRADRVGAYGHAGARTPTLDALAADGVRFESCSSTAPITLPSHASILTGLFPFRHGARNNGTHRLPDEVATLAEFTGSEGFDTGAVVSAFVLDSRFGLDQGFDRYDDDLSGADKPLAFRFPETNAEWATDRALSWLEREVEGRFFLWVHYFDPHAEYDAPEPYASEFAASPYDGEIAYVDAQIGRLLAGLDDQGRLDDTLVVVTADHGESLWEHGEETHGIFLYDATTRVPLIWSHPSLVPGKRVAQTVSSVDILPTALGLLGLSVPPGVDGVDLGAVLTTPVAVPPDRRAYSESLTPFYNHGWAELRSLRGNRWRYVRAPRPELYETARDPAEEVDLVDRHPSEARRLDAELSGLLADGELDSRDLDAGEMDATTRESLSALGYVWTAGETAGGEELPDPKDCIELLGATQEARRLVITEQWEEAETRLRAILAESPDSATNLSALASVLSALDRDEEALEVMRHMTTLPGAVTKTWVQLGELERSLDVPTWRDRFVAAQRIDPRDPMPWAELGMVQLDDPEQAEASFERAIELDERHADAWLGLGMVQADTGRTEEALRSFERAAELSSLDAGTFARLGIELEELNRVDLAIEHYERALEIDPVHKESLNNLGALHLRRGKQAEAEDLFTRAAENYPRYVAARVNLGVLMLGTQRPGRAAEILEQCVAEKPRRLDARLPLLAAYRELGRHADALELATETLERSTDNLQALTAAAVASRALGDEAAAIAFVRRAERANPAGLSQLAASDPELAAILEE